MIFTDLSPGSYQLQVTNSGPLDDPTHQLAQLDIIILPPWYRTNLAYFAYGLFVLTGLMSLFWFQRKRYALNMELQLRNEEAKRLKQLDEQKNTLFGNITHEFRTPLTVILGLTDQLLKDPKINRKKRLMTVRRNGQQLLGLVNEMLELTKVQAGLAKVNWIQDDAISFIQYLVESFQSYALSINKNLSFYADPEVLLMDFDPHKLQTIMSNFIGNAIKFTPEYGRIDVIVKGKNDELQIEVKDTGKGIAQDELEFIFDRFYRSKELDEVGTGLGLTLVRDYVKLMRGQIDVTSVVNEGSHFLVV